MTRALLPLQAAGTDDLPLLHETLVAADADLAQLTLDTPAEVDALAFRAAGTIQTLAATAACLPRPPSPAERDFARELGIALARAEWLRDLRGDIAAGRLRLPLDDARKRGHRARLAAAGFAARRAAADPRAREIDAARHAGRTARTAQPRRARRRNGRAWCWPRCTSDCCEQVDHGRELARTRAELAPWPRFWTAWRTAVRHA